MNGYTVTLYSSGDSLPPMPAGSFFHSPELFHIIEKTPGHRPFMAVVTGPDGKVAAHMMAVFRRTRWALFGKAQIYGEGDYESDEPSAPLFGMMLETLTHCFRSRLCLVAEISGLSRKMFAYRQFRQCGYFPIRWQEVSNSLHSVPPGERLTAKTLRNIRQGKAMGVTCKEARSREEVRAFHRLLARYYRTKWRRYIPSEAVIAALWDNAHIRIFLTFYKERLIGGSLCAYDRGDAWLAFMASRRKTYRRLHPDTLTVWHAIHWAWRHNYAHIKFTDVGLPYHGNPVRRFILGFGGKPVARYRWFRIFFPWVSRLVGWFYRE